MQQYTGLLFWVLCVFLAPTSGVIEAQNWSGAISVGGEGDESCRGLVVGNTGVLFFGGNFAGDFRPAGEMLPTYGGEDVYLAAVAPDRSAGWAVSLGSTLDDELDALALTPDGDLVAAGGFWLEGFFGDTVIESTLHPRAIFLARFDPRGGLRWARSIEGTDLKQVNALAVDEAGHLYLAGHFSKMLVIGADTLTAEGGSDLFLLKLNGDGELIWAVREGLTGDTRAIALAVADGEEIVVGGYFNDTTRIGGEVFTANTADRDVFLARYDNRGEPLWARKAGGVLDDDITSLALDESGDIYVAGYLVGVMELDENLRIQSSTGWSDFYLLRYRSDGVPLAARAMGGPRLQQASDLVIAGGRMLVSGFYQGEMTIDGMTIAADEFAFSSFAVALDRDLKASWLIDIPGSPSAFATRMTSTRTDEVWIGGTFEGELRLGDTQLTAQDRFDVFLAQLAPALTPVGGAPAEAPVLLLFPNPAGDWINVRSTATDYQLELFDSSGKRSELYRNPVQIPTAHLPAGIYWLRWQADRRAGWQRIIIQ